MSTPCFISLDPDELVFRDVKLSQAYTQTVRVTNALRAPVELTIKPGSAERYTVVPSSLRLRAAETAVIEVRLRVIRFAQRQKATEQGHRDVFHIKGSHFDQKFYSTFWLSPDPDNPPKPKQVSAGPASAAGGRGRSSSGSRSPSRSPDSSPSKGRKPVTKSVSFAEPRSARDSWPPSQRQQPELEPELEDGFVREAQALGQLRASSWMDATEREPQPVGSGSGGAGSAGSSPHRVHSALRQALAGMLSPRRSVSFAAPGVPGAAPQGLKRTSLDRAWSGGAGAAGTASPANAGGHLPPSASIDLGQLTGIHANMRMDRSSGEQLGSRAQTGDMAGSSIQTSAGTTVRSVGQGPPWASAASSARGTKGSPSEQGTAGSDAPSPGERRREGQTESSEAGSRQRWGPPSTRTSGEAGSSGGTAPSNTASGGASWQSYGGGRMDRAAGGGAAQEVSPPRRYIIADVEPNRGSMSPAREEGLPRRASLPEPYRSSGDGGTGVAGEATGSGAAWLHSRVGDASGSWQREGSVDERFLQEERRTLGLHLARDSLYSLAVEARRVRERSESPRSRPPATLPGRATDGPQSPIGPARTGHLGGYPSGLQAAAQQRSAPAAGLGTVADDNELGDHGDGHRGGLSESAAAAGLAALRAAAAQGGSPEAVTMLASAERRAEQGTPTRSFPLGRAGPGASSMQPAAVFTSMSSRPAPLLAGGSREGLSAETFSLQVKVQSLERQQAAARVTIEQQKEALRDQSAIVRMLQQQLEKTKADLDAATSTGSAMPLATEALEAERSALLDERTALEARLADAEAALSRSQQEATGLRRLQQELQSSQPDIVTVVEGALMLEQTAQEERERQSLELLARRDDRIQGLEAQVAELQQRQAQLEAQVSELRARAEAAEAQVIDVLREKASLLEAAQRERQQADQAITDLESRLAASDCLSADLQALQERAADAEARLVAADRRAAAAQERAALAEARASGMETVRLNFQRQRDEEMDMALTIAEDLRSQGLALQARHEKAMREQAESHRQQVAELQSRIFDLTAELAQARALPAGSGSSGGGSTHVLPVTDVRELEDHGRCTGAKPPTDPREVIAALSGGRGPAAGQQPLSGGIHRAGGGAGGGGAVELQAANIKLSEEVQALRQQLAGATSYSKERAWEQAELDRLRSLISDRDMEVADLASQVEVLKARLAAHARGTAGGQGGTVAGGAGRKAPGAGVPTSPAASPPLAGRKRASAAPASPARGRQKQPGKAGGSHSDGEGGTTRARAWGPDSDYEGDDGQAAVVEALRKQLAKSEAALRGAQERLAMMEARAVVAHETAGKGAEQLESAQRSMVGSTLELQRLQQELDSARAAAGRLNGRINDLVMAEQVARAEVDAAKTKLGQLQELHTAEVAGLQERLQRLAEHLAATQPEVLQVLLGPDYAAVLAAPVSRTTGNPFGTYAGPDGFPSRAEAQGTEPTPSAGASGGGYPGPSHLGDPAPPLTRERELQKAVDAAETAVAVMQDRLLAALKAAADANEEAARVQRETEWERDRLEAELRAAREEGALRIRNLEEAVSRLGARGGEAAQALAKAMAEADTATRREARLRSELTLAQQAAQRSNTQAAELRLRLRACEQALREAQVYGGMLPAAPPAAGQPSSGGASVPGASSPRGGHGAGGGMRGLFPDQWMSEQVEEKLRQQGLELARRQQVIARLVEVAERAQAELTDTQAELNMVKQTMPDPKSHLHQQYAELQRRLGATEAELRACREAKSSEELEVSRLQQRLHEKARELDAATERLAVCEREVAAKEEAAARGAVEVRGTMSKEVSLLSRRAAEARRAADEADARARELDTQLGNLRAELAEARAELEAQAAESRQLRLRGREEKRAAEEALRQARRSADAAKQEAQERRSQLAIMMETIEVLQAGNPGEREQRIVSLTAQLSAMTSRESLAEQRAQGLLADAEASSSRVQQLQSEMADLAQQVARLEQQLATAASNRVMLEGELSAARSEIRTRDAAALRSARELDDREQRVAFLEGELEALRLALNDCQTRHVDQLAREREDSAAAVRQARAESSTAAAASAQAARLERFQAVLDELVAWIESRLQQPPQPQPQAQPHQAAAPAAHADGNVADSASSATAASPAAEVWMQSSSGSSWVVAALQRFKALALESERQYLAASTDARLYRAESRWAWSRVQRLHWGLEQRTGEWKVAQARVQHLERAMSRRSEEAAVHALELVALQDKQLSALNERLQATTGKLVVATSQAAGAEAALASARAAAAALQRQVSVAAAERKELLARLAAAEMERAGSTEALHMGAEAALAQRDLAIRQYLDGQITSLLGKTDVKDKVMVLAREVCGLKLSESQLQAALAAAKHRSDAAAQLVASLSAALRASEDMIDQVLNQQLSSATAGPAPMADVEASGAGGTTVAPMASGQAVGSIASGLSIEVARLSAQLVAQSHEMFRLQEAALRAKQGYDRRESDIEELQAQLAAAELLLAQSRSEGSSALFALREQLSEVHEQDRQLLLREIRELQERLAATRDLASKDIELAEQRIAEMTSTYNSEIEKRVTAALAGQVDAAQLREVEARAARAESRAAHLEAQVEALQDALTAAEAQVVELQDIRDVTGSAVASLEATLARIEKSAAAAGGPTGATAGGRHAGLSGVARRVPLGGSQAASAASGSQQIEQLPQGLAGLSRELVRAKMAEAEAVRKMRAAARGEVELRQKLLQRDERITELKDQLAARNRALEELRRRAGSAEHASRGGPVTGATSAGTKPGALRSRSPSPNRVGAAASSQARPAVAGLPRRPASDHAPAEARAGDDEAEADYPAEQVAHLRVELAKRQAEIERLQAALAEANAAVNLRVEVAKSVSGAGKPGGQGGSATVDRLKDQLTSANAEIASALSTANGLLLRLSHQAMPTTLGAAAVGSSAPRLSGGGSPGRRSSSAASGALPSEPQVAPGTLAGIMQQLAAEVQAALQSSGTKARTAVAAASEPSAMTRGPHGNAHGAPAAEASSQAEASEDLRRLRQEHADLERQNGELSTRCEELEGELDQCRALVRRLQDSAGTSAGGSRDDQGTTLGGATRASQLLGGSVAALHAVCDKLQVAVSSGATLDTVQKTVFNLASELAAVGADLEVLRGELGRAAAQDPATPAHATASTAHPGESGPIMFTGSLRPGGMDPSTGPGAGRPPRYGPPSSEGTPGITASWDTLASSSVAAPGPPGATRASGGGGVGSDGRAGPAGPARIGAQHGDAASSSAVSRVGAQESQAEASGGPAPFALTQAQATAIATAAAKHKARADKWKQRSKELGAQLSLLNASLAARDAAVSERHSASLQQMEEELRACRDEAARLRTALSGAEAARRELEAAHAGADRSSDDESRALLARAAEATARAATLERQVEEERVQAAAALSSLQEEVAALKASVAQEKGERARLLVSLRESHGVALQAGDAEARFRSETLEAHAAAAAARATAERAEERAAAWKSEAEALRQRLQQAERGRAQLLAGLESRVVAAERRAAELGTQTLERLELLGVKLDAARAEAAAAPVPVEAQLRDLETAVRAVQARAEATRRSAMSQVQAGRWDALTRIARYQATIKQLQADFQQRRGEWEQEKAALQAAANEAVRRREDIATDLEGLRTQMSELQAAVDADRQQLTARHRQELQQRIDQERRIMAEEAIARAEAAVAATERSAQQAAAARLEAVEGDFGRRLAALEAARRELVRELDQVQEQFRGYQAQKAAEVAALEQRIRVHIEGRRGAVAAATAAAATATVIGGVGVRRARGGGGAWDTDGIGSGGIGRGRSRGRGRGLGGGGSAGHRGGGGGAAGGAIGGRLGVGLRRTGGRAVMRSSGRSHASGSDVDSDTDARQPAEPGRLPHPLGRPPLPPTAGHAAAPGEIATGAAAGQAFSGSGLGLTSGGPGLAPSQLVALARESEALVAAQREAAFERALRGRVEAQAGLLRGAVARLRARLRSVSEQLQAARAKAVSQEDHRQLQAELTACREQLKSARADSARRQKALQVLQGMAISQGLPGAADAAAVAAAPASSAFPTSTTTSAAGGAAAALRPRSSRFATAPAAGPSIRGSLPLAGAPTSGLSASVNVLPGPYDSLSLDGFAAAAAAGVSAGGASSHSGMATAAVAAAAAAAATAMGEYDPLQAALEAAVANARATAAALEAERLARQATEARLKEAKTAVERKSALIKDLKRRTEELEVEVQRYASAAGDEAAAEARARSLAAALSRKDGIIRELRERLDAAQASVAAGNAAAVAGGEELEAVRRTNTRLKADLAKREAALRAVQTDLDKERQLLAAATKQIDVLTRREAAARRQTSRSAGALRGRLTELVEALRALSGVLLQAIAAMDAAAERLQRAAAAAATSGNGGVAAAAATAAFGGSASGGMTAHDISQLTSLSVEEVQHLLGPGGGGGLGGFLEESAAAMGPGGAAAAAAASLRVAQRVGELLSMVEVALAAAAAGKTEIQDTSTDLATTAGDDTNLADDDDEELLRDQLMAAVASAADPAAAATAVLSAARGRQEGRRGPSGGPSRGSSAARGGGAGGTRGGMGPAAEDPSDPWDGRALQVLVQEVQAEAQRAEYDLAAALKEAGALG